MTRVPFFCLSGRFKKIVWEELNHPVAKDKRAPSLQRKNALGKNEIKKPLVILEEDEMMEALMGGMHSSNENMDV